MYKPLTIISEKNPSLLVELELAIPIGAIQGNSDPLAYFKNHNQGQLMDINTESWLIFRLFRVIIINPTIQH